MRDATALTLLMVASHAGHLAVVNILLERVAEAGRVDVRGQTALWMACEMGASAGTFTLGEACGTYSTARGCTHDVGHFPAGRLEVVRALLGAMGRAELLNLAARDGAPPLVTALNGENGTKGPEIALALLAMPGIRVDASGPDGVTALMIATEKAVGRTIPVLPMHALDQSNSANTVYADVVTELLRPRVPSSPDGAELCTMADMVDPLRGHFSVITDSSWADT